MSTRALDRSKVVKSDWSDNFGAILERLGGNFTNETVIQVVISSNERLVDPAHAVPLDTPVKLLKTYGCHYVGFYLADSSTAPEEAQEQQPQNALTILMQNAGRTRCIYAVSKLLQEEEIVIKQVKEAKTYTCGSVLFPPDLPLHDSIVVRHNCCCADPTEAAYYSATLKKVPPVCFTVVGEKGLVMEGVAELQQQYSVVRPLCFLCQSDVKTHKVSHPNNVAKRR